jgi:hypothetical protein
MRLERWIKELAIKRCSRLQNVQITGLSCVEGRLDVSGTHASAGRDFGSNNIMMHPLMYAVGAKSDTRSMSG